MNLSTQELAFQIVDYNQEYNAKLLVLGLVFIYSIVMLWYSYKISPKGCKASDLPLKDMISSTFMRVFSMPVLFLFPLLVNFMMFRGYSLMSLLNIMIAFYVLATLGAFIYIFLFGWQTLLELIGIKSLSGSDKNRIKNQINMKRRRRR